MGKTYVSSEKALSFDSKTILVVCQKSKISDWINHFRTNYDKQVFDLTIPKELDVFHGLSMGERFTCVGVINYDLLFRRKELLNLKGFTLILDESSLICNAKTKRTKFILKMKPQNVIMLSGTITSGKYEQLWTQLHLLGWDISEKIYNSQYVNWKKLFVGGMYINVVDKKDPYKNVERLKQKMRDHGTIFMKTEDVFNLPEQNFIQIDVPVSKEYKKFKRDRLITVDDVELVGDSTLSYRLYQRQLCTAYNPHKIKAFKDLLNSTQDRLIVFYNFNCELNAMLQIARSDDVNKPISIVNGSIKDLDAYENESDSITFVQWQAGARGLNLQKANKTIYFSLTESAELWMQAHKRTNRIGQEKPCFYYILTCEDSIEEQILDCLNRGVDFTNELFEMCE